MALLTLAMAANPSAMAGAESCVNCSGGPARLEVRDKVVALQQAVEQGQNCAEDFAPVSADDSSQKRYFEDLLKRGMKAPLKDFLKLWYPERPGSSEKEPYFFRCQREPWGPLVGGRNDELSAECEPDVLYSWGPREKLESMKSSLVTGARWKGAPNPGRPALFTALSPVSTFAYGLIQVRVKIRPEAAFSTKLFAEAGSGRIAVRTNTYQEFNIADSDVVESWSYGTPEQYDEIIRDILRIKSGKRAQGYYLDAPRGWGMRRVYQPADAHPANEDVLKRNLLELIRMILSGEGRIHYSEGACRNRAKFFATDRPTYFNPE